MNLGINCYPGSNKFLLRQTLASLFVKYDIDKVIQEEFDEMSVFIEKLFEYLKNILKLDTNNINRVILYNNNYEQFNIAKDYLVLFEQNKYNIKIIFYSFGFGYHEIYAKHFSRELISSICIHNDLDFEKFLELNNYDKKNFLKKIIIIQRWTQYFLENNKFNTINEYIHDMRNKGFVDCDYKKNINEVKIVLVCDGISCFKYRDFEDFIGRIKISEFDKIPNKNDYDYYNLKADDYLKKYFLNEFNNKNGNIFEIITIYNELKLIYSNCEIIGTKYTHQAAVNRNIFYELYNNKVCVCIDDDDPTNSITRIYNQYIKNKNKTDYKPNQKLIDEINNLLPVDYKINITDRKSRYEAIDLIYKYILKKNNIPNFNDENIKKINLDNNILINNLKKLIDENDIIIETKFIHERPFLNLPAGAYWYILPYSINPYLTINQTRGEDGVFMNTHNSYNYEYLIAIYVKPSGTQSYINKFEYHSRSNLIEIKNIYYNNLFKIGETKKMWSLNRILDFDSKVEIFNNRNYELVYVCKRHRY